MTDTVELTPEAEGDPVGPYDLVTKRYADTAVLEYAWMPLTSTDPFSGDIVLVVDDDDSLVPTRVPLS